MTVAVEFQIVQQRPVLDIGEFSKTRMFITDWNNKVCVIILNLHSDVPRVLAAHRRTTTADAADRDKIRWAKKQVPG